MSNSHEAIRKRAVELRRTKIAFWCGAHLPSMIRKAAKANGIGSNEAYIRRAVADALVRDLGITMEEALKHSPPERGTFPLFTKVPLP